MIQPDMGGIASDIGFQQKIVIGAASGVGNREKKPVSVDARRSVRAAGELVDDDLVRRAELRLEGILRAAGEHQYA